MLENLSHRIGTAEARASDPLQGLGKIIDISNIMQFIKLVTKRCRNLSQLPANTDTKVKCITEDRKIGSRFAKILQKTTGKEVKQ
jgi:hypothetical protein